MPHVKGKDKTFNMMSPEFLALIATAIQLSPWYQIKLEMEVISICFTS
jgi:hypothetical protein